MASAPTFAPPAVAIEMGSTDGELRDLEWLIQQADSGAETPEQLEAKLGRGDTLPKLDLSEVMREIEGDQTRSRLLRGDAEYVDEWTDEQVPLVTAMATRCRAAVAPATTPTRRKEMIAWCFAQKPAPGQHPYTFNGCCAGLGARPYVIQAMIHHQWFMHGIELPPLPFAADPVNQGLLSEGYLHAFDCGGDLVADTWRNPSTMAVDLIERVSKKTGIPRDQTDRALGSLLDAGILGARLGRIWFTGRSREYLAQRRTSFARSFIEPQSARQDADPSYALTPEEYALLTGGST